MMATFDIVGTTPSRRLADRFSSRYLLCAYYVWRGISLLLLKASLMHHDRPVMV